MTTLSLAAVLAESARRYPDKVAVVDRDERITYRDLWRQALAYAGNLRELGVRPGDTVALLAPNVADFPRAYYGILAAGATVVPVHLLLTAVRDGLRAPGQRRVAARRRRQPAHDRCRGRRRGERPDGQPRRRTGTA